MPQLLNLTDLKPNRISTNLYDYTMMITAPSGWGKTPFIAELFGEDALILAFENSAKGIEGSYVVNIDSYNTLNFYINQLKDPQLKDKFKVIVIDTLWMFDYVCENAVLDQYGKDIISDCLAWNKGYKVKDKKAIDILNEIKGMGYGICYVCHPTEQKVQVSAEKTIIKYIPKVSDRMKDLIVPEIDIKVFGWYDSNGNRVIHTQNSPYFEARCRVGNMDAVIPCNAEIFKQKFKEGIEKKVTNKELLVDKIENVHTVQAKHGDFKTLLAQVSELGNKLLEQGKTESINILNKELGTNSEGKQRTLQDLDESMVGVLEVILTKLKTLE